MDVYIKPSRVDRIWSEQKRKLLLHFPTLTEKDLQFETGRKYEMIERVSAKLGKTEAEMMRFFQT